MSTDNIDTPELNQDGLWPGDLGSLTFNSRRALVSMIKGPLITSEKHPELWNAVVSDTDALQRWLADIFLELIVDEDAGIAFTRMVKAPEEYQIPQVLRTESLSHTDTVILLHLRSELALAPPGERVIIGVDDIHEAADPYRSITNLDAAGYAKRIDASINRLKSFSLLTNTETETRLVVSPVLRRLFDPETVSSIKAEYEKFRAPVGQDGSDELPEDKQ